MSAFPTTIPVRLDSHGRIDVDVNCPACGYNLRMQRLAGACPECGAAIDVVDRDDTDRLDRADPAWQARIRRGGRWLHWAVIASVPLVLPGILLGAAALWLLTTKEPNRHENWMARGTRLSARWASVAAAAAGVVLLILIFALRSQGWREPAALLARDWDLFDLLASAAAACMAVALLEAWRHLFTLAARADGPNVARRCRATWKRYLVGVGLIMALAIAANLAERLDLRPPGQYTHWLLAASLLFVAAVLLWMWWATVKLTRDLALIFDPSRRR